MANYFEITVNLCPTATIFTIHQWSNFNATVSKVHNSYKSNYFIEVAWGLSGVCSTTKIKHCMKHYNCMYMQNLPHRGCTTIKRRIYFWGTLLSTTENFHLRGFSVLLLTRNHLKTRICSSKRRWFLISLLFTPKHGSSLLRDALRLRHTVDSGFIGYGWSQC